MVQRRWQQVWVCASEDAAGPAVWMSGLTAALQPTHRAAQLLLPRYTDADQHTRAAVAFHFSATNIFVLETASHTEHINY